jgi:hypothetical protein
MKQIFFILIIFSVIFFGIFLINGIQISSAATDTIILEAGIPSGPGGDGLPTGEHTAKDVTPAKYISFIYMFMIGLVGIASFASLVFYGIVWIYSGISEKKSEALEGIKNTFIGILLALSAFIILNTINPKLVTLENPKFVTFSAEDAKKNQPTQILGDRIEGYYYFTYRQSADSSDKVVWRYSLPYTSLRACKEREGYVSPDSLNVVQPCKGYNINNRYFYVSYNFVDSSKKKIPGFGELSVCVEDSAIYKSSEAINNKNINPDNGFAVGCYDNNNVFYDSKLTAEKVPEASTLNWCFTAVNSLTGAEFPTCESSKEKCKSKRVFFAEKPAVFNPITTCAQVK